jgi:uncharacterized Rossmann fold enzyme
MKKLKNVNGTIQSAPLDNVYNFDGLNNGGGCLFLVQTLGAKRSTPDYKFSLIKTTNYKRDRVNRKKGFRLLVVWN